MFWIASTFPSLIANRSGGCKSHPFKGGLIN
jgi:hypothetical protein